MQYRLIKKTGDEVSALGFGAMRLPLKNGKIDRDLAKKQIYHAIDNGVNFIDTAYLYGDSEKFLGEILQGEYKDKVKICTKLPSIHVKKYEDMENFLDEQLKRLQRDYIDYYLVHSVDLKTVNRLLKKGLIDFLNKAKREGFVMEPLKGGILAGKMPKDAEEIFKNADSTKTTAQWALQWVLNNRNISCVFSGMNSIEQVEDNLAVANSTTPLSMTFEEMETVELVKRVMRNSLKINCSTCGYCMPCPQGVNIPECLKTYNEKYLFNHKGFINASLIDYYQYVGGVMGKAANAGLCNGCGKCLRKCPQKLDIISELKKVKKEFEFPGIRYILPIVKTVGIPIYKYVIKFINR